MTGKDKLRILGTIVLSSVVLFTLIFGMKGCIKESNLQYLKLYDCIAENRERPQPREYCEASIRAEHIRKIYQLKEEKDEN